MAAQTRVVEIILVTVPMVTNIPLVLKPHAKVRTRKSQNEKDHRKYDKHREIIALYFSLSFGVNWPKTEIKYMTKFICASI